MKKLLIKILPIILVIASAMFVLTACVDADFVVQHDKMVALGYTPHEDTGKYESCEKAYTFVTMSDTGAIIDIVKVCYFYTDHDAISFEKNEAAQAQYDFEKNNPTAAENYEYMRIGKIFISGTKQGVKDALS